ncbi:helix-turn-helix domain-containing protein [Streptomyces sp. A012304]|uniref:helix-turn-helix domain-containing protein n=1 Tax=Streptomyces sp. A012304 TaxID=375446 RepID=UPI0035D48933
MDFCDTVRECCRRLLATATEPMTVAHIAAAVDTTPTQASRALRQLEAEGAAVRDRSRTGRRSGWTPDWWTAARISPSSAGAPASASRPSSTQARSATRTSTRWPPGS